MSEQKDCKCSIPIRQTYFDIVPMVPQEILFADNLLALAEALTDKFSKAFLTGLAKSYINCNKDRWLFIGQDMTLKEVDNDKTIAQKYEEYIKNKEKPQ